MLCLFLNQTAKTHNAPWLKFPDTAREGKNQQKKQ
jgi:hypothetical protein